MNPMHQLTRRPVKAAFGALLLALAGVILALSGGQFWAAARTRAGVEATYTTVAVVTGGKRQLVSSGQVSGGAGTAELEHHPVPAQGGPGQRLCVQSDALAGYVQFPQLQWR